MSSMLYNGVDDASAISSNVDLGISNEWSHMVWAYPGDLSPGTDQTIYSTGELNGGLSNSFDITIESGGVLSASIFNSSGVLIKKIQMPALDTSVTPTPNGFFFGNSWHQVVVTWDGSTIRVYRNGILMNPYMTNVTDIGGSQTNTARTITAGNYHTPFLGNPFEGFIHSHAHWNVELSHANIAAIYNGGYGANFDLNSGQGGYDNSSTLESWYQYGVIPSQSVIDNKAPTSISSITSTQSLDKVVRSAPLGGFLRCDGFTQLSNGHSATGVGDSMTISAWAKCDNLPGEGDTQDIVRLYNFNGGLNTDTIGLSVTTSGGMSYWVYECSDATNAVTNTVVGTTPVVSGQWYHILGCKNGSFSIRFFVNGLDDVAPVVAGVAVTSSVTRTTQLAYDGRLGFSPTGGHNNFEGDIHSVAIWSVAISEDSVKAIYSGGWANVNLQTENPCYTESGYLTRWWVTGIPSTSTPTQVLDLVASSTLSDSLSSVSQADKLTIATTLIGGCVAFEDTSNLTTSSALPVGIGNTFTLSAWIKPENLSSGVQFPLFIGPAQASLSANEISFQIDADDVNYPLILQVTGSTGAVLERVRYDNLLTEGEWQHITMVWNGGPILMYHNGTFVTPSVDTSSAGTVVDTSRFVEIGGSVQVLAASAGLLFEGKISHVGVWNVALGSTEVRTIASQGHGLDLRYNKNDYNSGEKLQHYYKLGEDTFSKGRDFVDTMRGTSILELESETGVPVVLVDSP
jgi:hypothetical protein